jgi:hypothetical protein
MKKNKIDPKLEELEAYKFCYNALRKQLNHTQMRLRKLFGDTTSHTIMEIDYVLSSASEYLDEYMIEKFKNLQSK